MTADKDPAVQAINDARALLGTLLSSDWLELHVVSGDTEIFLARVGAGVNPMREAAAPVGYARADAPVGGGETVMTAPHVATLVDILPAGTVVAAGQKVATLRVLDDREDVEAAVAGTVIRVGAAAGELVEYGAPLLSIAGAA